MQPKVSIIIVTLNSERTFPDCLKCIKNQAYKNIDEVLIVDGGSSDKTLTIAKKSHLPIKIIHGGYKNNQEARRAIGLESARNDICAYIDSDNYIVDKNWLGDMVAPLIKDKTIVAAQTLRYAAPKNATALNRYFGLIGAGDPVAYYLGKADRLGWSHSKWNLLGTVVEEHDKYLVVEFDWKNYPSVGCNGIVLRKSYVMKANWGKPENFVHTDVFVDIGKLGYNRFAIVKNEVFHNTADTLWTFLNKRKRYMAMYHQKLNTSRRHLIFDARKPSDIIKLVIFIIFSITLVEPLWEAIFGYIKKRDLAWFLHPFVCLGLALVYTQATVESLFLRKMS